MSSHIQVQLCAVCTAPLEVRGPGHFRSERRHGLAIQLGCSRGGWGKRENWTSMGRFYDFGTWERKGWAFLVDEVCEECFDAVVPLMKQIAKTLKERKGVNSHELRLERS